MSSGNVTPDALVARIAALAQARGRRIVVALAGPPGAGKSTLAETLVAGLKAAGESAVLLPMDGFHLDNAVLSGRGLLSRKGAPETFDAEGFVHLVTRLAAGGAAAVPVFDRAADLSRAGARIIGEGDRIVLAEGNYLLLGDAPWDRLHALWDLTIRLDVPLAELERRLVARWRDHGLDPAAARARAMGNDIPNAERVMAGSVPADVILR